MDALYAVVLGIIEGLTEFLPISSTGHLLLAERALGIDTNDAKWDVFLIVCQFGAIAAVVLYFWQRLRRAATNWRGPLTNHLFVKLIVATAPALVIGAATRGFVKAHLETPLSIAAALIVGAIAMEFIDRRFRYPRSMSLDDVTFRQALLIGLAQCLSIVWPGVSRAAATIMGGMVVGLSPAVAAEFSFFVAIPTMTAASIYSLYKHRHDLSGDTAVLVLTGSAVAFVVALLVIAGFMRFVQTRRFTVFAVYRVVLGVIVLLWLAT